MQLTTDNMQGDAQPISTTRQAAGNRTEGERRRYDLAERFLEYAVQVLRLTEAMNGTRAASHVAGQLLRSGTAPLFNHGEAQAAESPRDFVHKLRIVLKELKESRNALRLIARVPLVNPAACVDPLLAETEELIRITAASIRTAEKRIVREASPEWKLELPNGKPNP